MQQSINQPTSEPLPPTEPTTSRLRTVTGSRWPRKCACGCGLSIPRDSEVRYVVDFGAPKPYPAYLRERSPDYGTYHGSRARKEDASPAPGFRPASELIRGPPKSPVAPGPTAEVAHEDAETTGKCSEAGGARFAG
jgi:hypothetical protein